MTKTTSMIAMVTGLALYGASGAAAQTADSKAYVDLSIAGQTQSVTLATSSTFSLYGEQGTTSTSQTVGKGLVFDGGAGYRVWNNLAIGVAISMFNRSPIGTASVTIPDPLAFGAFTTVAASPPLTQTEVGTHIKVAYFLRVNDKMRLAISAGPSFVRLSKDIATASVVNGAAVIAVATQTGTGAGVNGGVDLQYFFTPWLGGGIFVRYVAASVDLPAAAGVAVGGFQGGLGLRVRF
jgi:hypothetical protein